MLLNIVGEKNVLPNSQFGFQNKQFTVYQIYCIVDKIFFSLKEKHYCTSVSQEFARNSQEFDRVWHAVLLFKLKFTLLTWPLNPTRKIVFLLTLQLIDITTKTINVGISWGVVIAPLLFIIFILDQLTVFTILIDNFAYDKAIIANSFNPDISFSLIQKRLTPLEKWYESKSIHFTRRQKKCPLFIFNEQVLPRAQCIRYLGVTIVHRLTLLSNLHNKLLFVFSALC